MKKLKKLKLKKEVILTLDKDSMKNICGGDFTQGYFTCTTIGIPSVAVCPPGGYNPQGTNGYCGTLNNCGTGAGFCVTNDCFLNSKPCY